MIREPTRYTVEYLFTLGFHQCVRLKQEAQRANDRYVFDKCNLALKFLDLKALIPAQDASGRTISGEGAPQGGLEDLATMLVRATNKETGGTDERK